MCVCVCARARAFVRVLGRVGVYMSVVVHVALFIEHATRTRYIVTSFVAPLASPYFSTLSHKRHDFRKKKSYWTLNVFWFSQQRLSNTFLILSRIQWDTVINVKRLDVKYALFLSNFNETWIFSTYFRKNSSITFHQNPSTGSRIVPCARTDWRKNRHDEANSRFSQFCERA